MRAREIEDLKSCRNCGIVFNCDRVEVIERKETWDSDKYLCPLCKTFVEVRE